MQQRSDQEPLVSLRRKLMENLHASARLKQQAFIDDLLGDLHQAEQDGLPQNYVDQLASLVKSLMHGNEHQQGDIAQNIQALLNEIESLQREKNIIINTAKLLHELEKVQEIYLREKEHFENASEDELADEWLRKLDEDWVESLRNFAETSQLIELGTPTAVDVMNTILNKPVAELNEIEVNILKIICRDLNTSSLRKSTFSHVLGDMLEHDFKNKGKVPEYWKLAEGKSLLQLYASNNDRIAKLKESGSRPRSFSLYSRNSDGHDNSPRKKGSRRGSLSSPRRPASLSGSPRKHSTPRSRPTTPRGSSAESSPRKSSLTDSLSNLRQSLSNLSPRRLTPRNESPLVIRLIERCQGNEKPLIEIDMDVRTRLTLDALNKPFSEISEDEFYKLKDMLLDTEDNNLLLHSNYIPCVKLGSIISYIKNNNFNDSEEAQAVRANNSDSTSIIDLYLRCHSIKVDATTVDDYLKENNYPLHLWLELIKFTRDAEYKAKHGKSPR